MKPLRFVSDSAIGRIYQKLVQPLISRSGFRSGFGRWGSACAVFALAALISEPAAAQSANPLEVVLTNDTGMSSSQIWVQLLGGTQVTGSYSNVFSANQTLAANTAYSLDQLTDPGTGRATLHISEFSSGRIYLSYGAYGLQNLGSSGGGYTPAVDNPLDPNFGTRFQYFEQTIIPQNGGTSVWADLSYIDFTAISLSMYAKHSGNNTVNASVGNGNQTSQHTQVIVDAALSSSANQTLAVQPQGASSSPLPNSEFARVISPQFAVPQTYQNFTPYLTSLGNSSTTVNLNGTFVGTGTQPTGTPLTQSQTYDFTGNFTNSNISIPGFGNSTNGGIVLTANSDSGNSNVSWLPASYNPNNGYPGVGNSTAIYLKTDDLNAREGIYGNDVKYYVTTNGGNATYYESLQNDVYGRAVGDLLAGLSLGYVGSTVNATFNGNATTIGALPSTAWWAGGSGENATLANGANVTWTESTAGQGIWFAGAQPGDPNFYNLYSAKLIDVAAGYAFPLQDRLGTALLAYNNVSANTTNTYLEVVVNQDGTNPLPTAKWTGLSGNWTDASSWTVNGTNALPPAGASVQFVGNHTQNIAVQTGGNQSAAGISFNYGAGNFTITGNTITLAGDVVNSSNRTQTINSGLLLASNSTFTAAFGDLTIGGAIGLSSNATARTLTISGTQNSTVSGVISDGAAPGGSVVKTGTGTLTLGGNNSFTGGFLHNGGTVVAGSDLALGTGALSFQGGTLQASGNRTFANSSVSLGGSYTFAGSPMLFTGNLSIQGGNTTSTIHTSADVEFSGGVIASAGTVAKSGPGNLTFSGSAPISYNGTLAINEGALVLAKTGGASFGGSLVVGDGIGAANSAVARLQGGNQTGATTSIQIASDGLFDLQTFTTTVGNLTMSGGSVAGTGALNISNNSTVIFNGGETSSATISVPVNLGNGSATFAVNKNNAPTQMTLNGDLQGNGNFAKGGSGVLALAQDVTYSGTMTIGGGVLASGNMTSATVIASNGALSPGGVGAIASITLGSLTSTSGNSTSGAFLMDLGAGETSDHIAAPSISVGNSTIFLFNSSTFTSGSASFTLLTGSSGLTVSPSTLQFASINIPGLTGSFSTSGNSLLFNATAGVIATWVGGTDTQWTTGANWGGSSPATGADIVFSGSNTSVSTAGNQTTGSITFTGSNGFTISDNTITLGGDLTNNSSAAQTVNSAIALNASRTIAANTGDLVLGGGVTLSTSGALANTLTFSTSSNLTITASGPIANGSNTTAEGGGIVKTGAGTLALTGNNSGFTGPLTISGGTVAANSSNALGNGAIATNTLTINGGTLLATGNIISGSAQGINRAIKLTGNGTFDTNGFEIVTSGPISGAGTLIKAGNGTLVLETGSAINSYSGGTLIQGGSILMLNSSVLGAPGSQTTVQAGSLTTNGTFTVAGQSLVLNGTGDGNNGALHITGTLPTNNVVDWTGPISLGSNASIQVDSQQTLNLSGASVNIGSDSLAFNVLDGAKVNLVAPLTGSGGITKSGNGTLYVSGGFTPNAGYNGTTTISTGVLTLQSTGALGIGTSAIAVASGGGLQIAPAPATGASSQVAQFGLPAVYAFRSISLAGNGVSVSSVDQGALSINLSANLTVSGNVTLTDHALIRASAGALTLSGDINTGSNTLTVVNRASVMAFTGNISGGGGLTMNGTSLNGLVLSGNNSYTGQTVVEGNTYLAIAHSNALGNATTGTTVQTNGALWLQGGISTGAESLSINGTGFGSTGALRNFSGNNTFGGVITMAGNSQINSANGTLTLSQDFSASHQVTLVTESATAGLTFSGNFTPPSAGLNISGNGTTTFSGQLLGSSGLTINGTGTTVVSNASNYTAGSYQLLSGTLAVGTNGAGTTVTFGGPNAILSPGGSGSAGNATFSSLTATSGGGFLMDLGGNATTSDQIVLSSGYNMSGNFTFAFNSAGAVSGNYTLLSAVGGNGGSLSASNLSFTSSNPDLAGVFILNSGGPGGIFFNATVGGAVWAGGSGSWNSGGDWSLGDTPAGGSAVVFSGNSTAMVDTQTNRLTGSITFASGAGAFTLANNTISTYGHITNNSSATQTISSGLGLAGNVTVNAAAGNLALSGPVGFGNGTAQTLTFTGTNNTTVSGAISNGSATSGALVKTGTGTLTLTGNNTFTGTTTITSGTLVVNGSMASGNQVSVGADGTLGGSGTLAGQVTVAGTLAPGNSPGSLGTGSQVWVDGGDYNWQVFDATESGFGTGYDTVAITGGLDLSGLSTGGFSINLWSLSAVGPDASGNAINFVNTNNYSWQLVSTTTGITGFSAGDFTIHTAANNGTNGFSNPLSGSFSVGVTGNDLMLNYTAIPEPTTWALLCGSAAVLAVLRRRARRRLP